MVHLPTALSWRGFKLAGLRVNGYLSTSCRNHMFPPSFAHPSMTTFDHISHNIRGSCRLHVTNFSVYKVTVSIIRLRHGCVFSSVAESFLHYRLEISPLILATISLLCCQWPCAISISTLHHSYSRTMVQCANKIYDSTYLV